MNGNSTGTLADYAFASASNNKEQLQALEIRVRQLETFIQKAFPKLWQEITSEDREADTP